MGTKKETIVQARVSRVLKERFLKALEHEGLTESDFINQKIVEFVREVELKMNPIMQLAGKKIEIDHSEFSSDIRSAVAEGVTEALMNSGVDPDDILQVRVEHEYHVKVGKTDMGEVITEPDAYVVLIETCDHKGQIIVDKHGNIKI